jgi:hypothetical protein
VERSTLSAMMVLLFAACAGPKGDAEVEAMWMGDARSRGLLADNYQDGYQEAPPSILWRWHACE